MTRPHAVSILAAPTATVSRRSVAWAAVILIAATIAAYLTSFRGALVFDDIPGIENNPTIRDLGRLDLLLVAIGPEGGTLSGRPVPNLTLAVNYAISGQRLWSYHAVNLLIHLAAGLTLFGIVRRTLARLDGAGSSFAARLREQSTPAALAIALLWSVHPLQTESVTYLVQRVESLMGLFYLLTIYCFVRAIDSPRPRIWFGAAFVACLTGMGCKEVMVTAPLIVWLYDVTFVTRGSWREAWPGSRSSRRKEAERLAKHSSFVTSAATVETTDLLFRHRRWFYVSLASTWILLGALVMASGGRGGTAGFAAGLSSWRYALTQCAVIFDYLKLALWPHPLVFDHNIRHVDRVGDVALAAIVLLGLLALSVWLLVRRPAIGFLCAWLFLILAPTSSVVPVADAMVEHRMYLPLAGVIGLLVLGAYRWLGSAAWPLAGAAAVAFGVVTACRNLDYRSPMALWEDTVTKVPGSARAHSNLGAYLFEAGQLDGARRQFATALQLDPQYASAHYNLGKLLEKTGDSVAALAEYETALRFNPRLADAHMNAGDLLDRQGQGDAAVAHFEAAVRLEPLADDAHTRLGNALLKLRHPATAIEHFKSSLEIDAAQPAVWCSLARAELLQHDTTAARRSCERALQLKPDFPEAHFVLGNLEAAAGNTPPALVHLRRALELAPGYVAARNNLANVLLLDGQVDAAITEYERILRDQPGDRAVQENLARALELRGKR